MRPTRITAYLLALALGLGAAFGLAACGKTNRAMLRGGDADALKADLSDVSDALDGHDCKAAAAAIRRAQDHVSALPSTTSQRLTDQLRRGLDRLARQADKDCREKPKTTTTATTTTATTTIPTTTTAPPTTPTTPTTTTPTTPTTTTPTTPTTPPTTTSDTGGTPGAITTAP